MAENMPARSLPAVEWLEARIVAWNSSYASIGLTSAQVVELGQDLANARGAFTSVQEIRAESKGKTTDFHGKAKVARDKAAGMIANIKAYAEAQTDPAVVYGVFAEPVSRAASVMRKSAGAFCDETVQQVSFPPDARGHGASVGSLSTRR